MLFFAKSQNEEKRRMELVNQITFLVEILNKVFLKWEPLRPLREEVQFPGDNFA